jgi:uncharacterized protein YegP (UPF0339 family)
VLKRLALAAVAGLLPSRPAAAQTPNLYFRVTKSSAGQYRWVLRSGNNQTIATSGESYRTKAACLRGIELVRTGAASAELKDTTI